MPLLIAGERSGVGKTTVTLALLSTLRRWQSSVQSFKVGPDYIDPMFHTVVTGRSCRNLDPVLTSEAYVQQCFTQHRQTAEYTLVEGVMGLFDGATGSDDWASTAHVARLLNLPILLVVDCSRMSRSIAAVVHGYRSFDSRLRFAGIVLNRVGSDRHLELLKAALQPLELPILGVLRRQDNITIPDRHLGLVPTAELSELTELLDRLALLGEQAFDWTQLLPLLKEPAAIGKGPEHDRGPEGCSSQPTVPICQSESLQPESLQPESLKLSARPRIAVAYDRAFSFYYADNWDLLASLGAELAFWSPLTETSLPEGVSGLYFGGGFPEMFAAELAANGLAQQAVRSAILAGMPTYGECGGLMYLTEALIDFEGQVWDMVGVLPTKAQMGQRLTLGYRCAIAQQDSSLMPAGTTVWGHEFHRSTVVTPPETPFYHLRGYDGPIPGEQEGWQKNSLQASYVHLHWGACPQWPARFIANCDRFAQTQR